MAMSWRSINSHRALASQKSYAKRRIKLIACNLPLLQPPALLPKLEAECEFSEHQRLHSESTCITAAPSVPCPRRRLPCPCRRLHRHLHPAEFESLRRRRRRRRHRSCCRRRPRRSLLWPHERQLSLRLLSTRLRHCNEPCRPPSRGRQVAPAPPAAASASPAASSRAAFS